MKVKSENEVAQSCPMLSDPMDCSLPGSSVHGILEARILEWEAILFSKESSLPRDQTQPPALQADFLPSESLGKPIVKHREFQVKVLDSQHRLPLIGCIVLARHLPHIQDDFKDKVQQQQNSLYKGFSSVT